MTTEFIPVDEKKFDKKLRAMEKQQEQNRKQLDIMVERHFYETELAQLDERMRRDGASEQSIEIALLGHYELLKIIYHSPLSRAERANLGKPIPTSNLTSHHLEEVQARLLS